MIVVWRCRDGRQIAVGEMENNHILNCVRYILRGEPIGRNARVFTPREWVMIFTAEQAKRIRQGRM